MVKVRAAIGGRVKSTEVNVLKMYSRNKVELGCNRKFGVVTGGGRFGKEN